MLTTKQKNEHIALKSVPLVRNIAKEFLGRYNMSGFGYTRVMPGRARLYLPTVPEYVADMISHIYPTQNTLQKLYDTEQRYYLSDLLVQDEKRPSSVRRSLADRLLFEKERYDSHNKMWFMRRHDSYIEGFAFTFGKSSAANIQFYFNHLEEINQFCNFFLVAASDIIKRNETCLIQLPPENIGAVKPNVLNRKQQICIHLCAGKTAKEIAELTCYSKRTVETYLAQLKEAHNCRNIAHLAATISREYGYLLEEA